MHVLQNRFFFSRRSNGRLGLAQEETPSIASDEVANDSSSKPIRVLSIYSIYLSCVAVDPFANPRDRATATFKTAKTVQPQFVKTPCQLTLVCDPDPSPLATPIGRILPPHPLALGQCHRAAFPGGSLLLISRTASDPARSP